MRTTRVFVVLWTAGLLLVLASAFLVKPPLGPGMGCSGGMMLVAIAAVWFWRWCTGAEWRWFCVGAAMWAIAVGAKIGINMLLAEPLAKWMVQLPLWGLLTAGTIQGGLMTGLTEILFVFIAALVWRRMAATAPRGVAVGVGAGAFEASLLALVGMYQAINATGAGTPDNLVFLAPALERLTAILCHTAARTLVLLAVVRRQWMLFACGFLLLSGVDALTTYLAMTGRTATMSLWEIDALIAPFGLVSIPIIIWCVRRWPLAGK